MKGIKNIDREITLQFYKQAIPKAFTLDNSNMKAIYGENGAGKSAIIHAMDIYKNLCLAKNYLQDTQTTKLLMELINKKERDFIIEVTFLASLQEEKPIKLKHHIHIQLGNDASFHIIYECLKDVSKRKEICLIEINNGEIMDTSFISNHVLIDQTKNLLRDQSLISIWAADLKRMDGKITNSVDKYGNDLSYCLCLVLFLAANLVIYSIDIDQHDEYETEFPLYELINQASKQITRVINMEHSYDLKKYHMINAHADVVYKKNIQAYEQKIKRLTAFIKLLKDDLYDIEIEKKENRETFICEKYFVYDGYRINIEFESTGIKKLVTLFDALESFVNGKIVFIDEFDANIHDVILTKMLEYFSEFAAGQLCFTTHNLGPMEVLRKRKFAIDFLSQDSQITSWKSNGHYSVINLYRKGMIEHHPFHLEPIDFAGIFEIVEE